MEATVGDSSADDEANDQQQQTARQRSVIPSRFDILWQIINDVGIIARAAVKLPLVQI